MPFRRTRKADGSRRARDSSHSALASVGARRDPADMANPVQTSPRTRDRSRADSPRGHSGPTQQQWAGSEVRAGQRSGLFVRSEVTEGTIAIDDDLTTPVFSHYSGRVIKVIAMLGDVVEPGAPLFVIHASEFVQAQNDLITALANLTAARSQLAMAQTTEKRNHELYLAQGGALKDWQQSQTDLITARNTVRSDEIALHAVRSRLAHSRQERQGDRLARSPADAKARSGGDRDRAGRAAPSSNARSGSANTSTARPTAPRTRSSRSAICRPCT